jgi:trans-aconitate methyltransferase
VWADLGAGTGTFTRALRALLPRESIYAVDNDPAAIGALQEIGNGVIPIQGDFSRPSAARSAAGRDVGQRAALRARPEVVLRRVVNLLRPGGRVVIVEYDRRAASRWVPYP